MLSYELAKKDLKVLFLDKEANPPNITCYSYGDLAYWSGSDGLFCHEGIEIHRNLSEKLGIDTQFRELVL